MLPLARRCALTLGFLSSLLHVTTTHAAPITIDDFSAAQSPLVLTFPPAGTSASSSTSAATIFGGERDLSVALSSGVIAGNTMSASVSSDYLSYSQDATIAGNLVCQWDGADASSALNATGLGGVDLTVGGTQDALLVNVVFDDLPANVQWTFYSDAANASTSQITIPGLIFSATSVVLPYSTFTPSLGAGASFSNVGAITLSLGSSVTAPDVVLDFVQTTATLSAQMSVALLNDVGADGEVNPGDTLRWTAVITDRSDFFTTPSNTVSFRVGPWTDASLVVGSVTTSSGTVTTGNAGSDAEVDVDVTTIADGAAVTITFDTIVRASVGADAAEISSQASVTSSTVAIVTDDLGTEAADDATAIPLVASSSLGATLTALLATDADANGVLTPGDTLRYTAVISNDGDRASPPLVFAATPDAASTLVVGSVTGTTGTITTGNAGGDADVSVMLGGLAGNASATVTFDVTVPLASAGAWPAALVVAGTLDDGATQIVTDDPGTAEALDATRTALFTCGDTLMTAPETCDDGNVLDGDGCSASCVLEVALPDAGVGEPDAGTDAGTGPVSGGSCGCTVPGDETPSGSAMLVVGFVAVAMLRRTRRAR